MKKLLLIITLISFSFAHTFIASEEQADIAMKHQNTFSPRLLIHMNPSNSVTAYEVAEEINAMLIALELYTSSNQLKDLINKIDIISNNHIILLYGDIRNIQDDPKHSNEDVLNRLAHSVGYDYVSIEDKKDNVIKIINKKIKTIPLTDEVLPRIDKKTAGELYHLMMQVDQILKAENIPYWAMSGTLLGTVRHKGLIPWDDDLDIGIHSSDISKLENLRLTLKEKGLGLHYHVNEYYKIFPLDGKSLLNHYSVYEGKILPWKYPFVDLIPMHIHEGDTVLRYKSDIWRSKFKYDYLYPQEVQEPLKYMKFGPMNIPVSHNALNIIKRLYGNDWNDICYVEWDHANEKRAKKIKVALTDRSETPFELPASFESNNS